MLTINAHVVSALTVLVVQEVVSVDGPVLGIAVDDSYLTLPAEVFTNKVWGSQRANNTTS